MEEQAEVWESVPYYERYEVSTLGRIRRKMANGNYMTLKPYRQTGGYLQIKLGRKNPKMVHRLVLQAHMRLNEQTEIAHHIDGDKQNNRLENLRWATQRENVLEAYRSGRKKPAGVAARKAA